jgi:hypothetical protein
VSDNTKITSFYTLKAQPTYQTPLNYFGQGKKQETVTVGNGIPESSKVRELFTNHVASDTCADCAPRKAGQEGVSNLVADPKLNLKYDDAWFLQHNPQYWENLRTVGLLKDQLNNEDDPIMKLNPTLYKVVQQESKPNFTDPFQKIMEQQDTWIRDQGFVKNSIYRSDLDHPNSLHNMTTG